METLIIGGAIAIGFFALLLYFSRRLGEVKVENDRLNRESDVANEQKQALADRPSAVDRLRDGKF